MMLQEERKQEPRHPKALVMLDPYGMSSSSGNKTRLEVTPKLRRLGGWRGQKTEGLVWSEIMSLLGIG